MKKFTLILALLAFFAFSACGSDKKEDVIEPDEQSVETNADAEEQQEALDDESGDKEEADKPSSDNKTEDKKTEQKPAQKPAEQPAQKPAEQPKPETPAAPTQPETEQKPAPKPQQKALTDIMASILNGVETPKTMETAIDASSFKYYTFADYVDGAEALASEALVNAIAHSVVLVRLPDGADVNAFASTVKANADPRKWICVEAEKVVVKTNGNLVLLVMSSQKNADAIASNFAAL